jgi:hypothetical protein
MVNSLIKAALACGLLSLAASAALAQSQAPPCAPTDQTTSGIMMVRSRPGCPFSAVVEIDRTQTLADGTQIQTKAKNLIYRDSLGRIRYEMYAPSDLNKDSTDTPSLISIYDPVTQTIYTLSPQKNHVAYRNSMNPPAPSADSSARPPDPPQPPPEELRPQLVREDLGTQEMDGVTVSGERTTRTIPAGAENNDQPITIRQETWFSTDIGMPILRKSSDPRYADTEERVTSLDLSEPNAALFQPPSGYTIQDQSNRDTGN